MALAARQEAEWVSTEQRKFCVVLPPVEGVASPGFAAPGVAALGVDTTLAAADPVVAACVAATGVDTTPEQGVVVIPNVVAVVEPTPEQGVVVLPIVVAVIDLVIVYGILSTVVRQKVS